MRFTASAHPIDGALRHAVDVNGRHAITDEPESLGGSDTAPTPHELLAAAVASCVSTMVVLYGQRHGWDLGDLRVDVEYDADPAPRRAEIQVHRPPGLGAEQVTRLERVVATCPVRRALQAGFVCHEQLIES